MNNNMEKLLIVGLGNYPQQYNYTRHNVGFMAIDKLTKELSIDLNNKKFNGMFGYKNIGKYSVILAKPYTLMNLSGDFVQPLMDYYKIDINNLLVICDDVDTPFGSIRVKKTGSSGGQNGLKSIINRLNSQDFKRVKIGIGRPNNGMSMADYVLSKLSRNQLEDLDKINNEIVKLVLKITEDVPFDSIMSQFNKKIA